MNWIILLACIIICELAGVIGGIFSSKSISGWYQKLKKPSFNPPDWIFGPVWTLLYALMGISLAIIIESDTGFFIAKGFGLMLFKIQLFLNVLWSVIFFGLKKPGLAFFEILLLWISIGATIFEFYIVSGIAAYLLVPYFLWVSFAAVLNLKIWILNRKKK